MMGSHYVTVDQARYILDNFLPEASNLEAITARFSTAQQVHSQFVLNDDGTLYSLTRGKSPGMWISNEVQYREAEAYLTRGLGQKIRDRFSLF